MVMSVLPISLRYATLGAFQHHSSFLKGIDDVGLAMRLWVAAASGLQDTDDVRERMVDALLQVAYDDDLRHHIPAAAWEWLKKRPVLPPGSRALQVRASRGFFQMVRTLGDIELTTSYLFVIWSERSNMYHRDCEEMRRLIREELDGIHVLDNRAVLIQRLDHILSQREVRTAGKYEELKEELLKLDEEGTRILTGSRSTFMCALPLPCS
ncbi:hypothetical protein BJ322DRAFT_152245 [Thelephora terrestris]|uniref:Uncharacterized protein n=1 Tax=Thelephora terrestris TaxID=56493 RepID=A0A9P6L5I0_9AGAM|nr:hypothetical protein BJ322DRAFT_152245 [Thelephora terrestris]